MFSHTNLLISSKDAVNIDENLKRTKLICRIMINQVNQRVAAKVQQGVPEAIYTAKAQF